MEGGRTGRVGRGYARAPSVGRPSTGVARVSDRNSLGLSWLHCVGFHGVAEGAGVIENANCLCGVGGFDISPSLNGPTDANGELPLTGF